MIKKKLFLYLLGIFIVTIVLIVFLQYSSSRNVNQLIEGNQELLTELQRRIAIHNLREDLYYVSTEERKMIHQQLPVLQPEINNRRKKIATEIFEIKNLETNKQDPKLVMLDSLVSQLLAFHTYVIDSGWHDKKLQTELILSGRGDTLLSKVIESSSKLNAERDERLANLIETTDRNGLEAKKWGIILAILAIVSSLYAFGYITNKIRIQRLLIDQLNESEKKVREAATIKDNFMANMSHEIRTPMNAILGFTQLLRKEPLNKKSTEYVRSIQHSGEHLLTIVNDVLDFSKIEAGMLKIESIPFSILEIVESLKTMFIEKARQKNISLDVQVGGSLPEVVVGDPVRLKQILVNIISNAIKFTPAGNVSISVEQVEKAGNTVKIGFLVRDTGIGIPQNKIANIFERFNQVDDEASRQFGGTGLGLSIVKQLIELQRGQIQVKSELNQGTEVQVIIPYQIRSKQTILAPIGRDAYQEEIVFGKKISILVVEDNLMNQSLMRHLLTNWNLDFTIASNGLEGIEALRNRDYDIVLMDIQMPGLDGYATTEKIRNELCSSVPIIAMTAHAMKGEADKCLAHGMNAYLSKPISEADLIKLIGDYTADKASEPNSEDGRFKIINLKYLKEIAPGKPDFIRRMVSQFVNYAKDDVKDLEKSFEMGDYPAVKSIAHNLKTSVAFVGLTPKLDLPLSYIEDRVLTEESGKFMAIAISTVKTICNQALEEARTYLAKDQVPESAL